MKSINFLLIVALLQFTLSGEEEAAPTSKVQASCIPTFHCMSVYWSPEKGEAGKKVLVKFREANQKAWHDGLPMRYNPVKTPECKGDYRGSIVNLKPGTAYEISLTLEGTDLHTTVKGSTWSEKFPIASTVKCENSNNTLTINKSGTPEGYILYDGSAATIDTANKADLGISVDANYVILRGFTIKNVKQHGIRIMKGHHIVIEECDISKWGSEDEKGFGVDYQGGVYSNNKDIHAVVVQRCKFHHPSWNSNSWAEDHNKSRHPAGPQTIVFWESEGNNVLRYNECWSDDKHYFNDVMGGSYNASYRGFPGADSDVYCNYVANCWDDGLEIEGGNQNVRVWNNYIENIMIPIANAATSIGPLYVWRNVSGRSYSPPGSSWDLSHGPFMKMGFADGEQWMTGHMYIFNNTIFQPKDEGADALGGSSRIIKHCVSRNNIFNVRPGDTHCISTEKKSTDNDFDFDLLSAKRYPADAEKHGVPGTPKYVAGVGFSFDTKTGNFQQAPDSPGVDKAEIIPNFCDVFAGAAPDMGAQEIGAPPMVVGVKAEFIPPGSSVAASSNGAKEPGKAAAVAPKVDATPHRDALTKTLQSDAAKKNAKVFIKVMGAAREVVFEGADAEGVKVKIEGNTMPLRWKDLGNEDFINLGLSVCGDDPESVLHAGAIAAAEKLDSLAEKASVKLVELKSDKAKELDTLRGR